MVKRKSNSGLPNFAAFSAGQNFKEQWSTALETTTLRFEREYNQEKSDLPAEVKELPIFERWQAGTLQNETASAFWELKKPKKKENWLDLGCGLSFLIYPWYQWDAFFYGQEVSKTAQEIITSRAPQLNSKLFKGVKLGSAHLLDYEANWFAGVITTGWSCYYPIDYWERVFNEVKRVLKPDGYLIFDAIDPDAPLAEDWAILETYLGAEVLLTPLEDWQKTFKQLGGKITKTKKGELFTCWAISFKH